MSSYLIEKPGSDTVFTSSVEDATPAGFCGPTGTVTAVEAFL